MECSQFPSDNMAFTVLGSSAPVLAPRVGKLAVAGRKALSTPHYVPLTSRGTVPHIAHDMLRKETALNSMYIGLEDCMYLLCLHWVSYQTMPPNLSHTVTRLIPKNQSSPRKLLRLYTMYQSLRVNHL